MKFISKIILLVFCLVYPNNFILTAQNESFYHSFNSVMYIPIIVDHQEELKFKDGTKKERNNPEKEITIQVNLNANDMRFNKGVFTGVILKNIGTVRDEIITYKGKVSKDKQKLEYIEIKSNIIQYRLAIRENIEKTTTIEARFENIPKSSYGSGYKFKHGISKIVSVGFDEKFSVPRSHYVNTYTETFVSINEKKIDKYYSGVRADFKPTDIKAELKNDPTIKVLLESTEEDDKIIYNVLKSYSSHIINELMKHPEIIVVEGVKIQKLLDEIELSQSDLVSKRTKIEEGRILVPDIELIISIDDNKQRQKDEPLDNFVMRCKYKIIETGQIIDPNYIFSFGKYKGDDFIKKYNSYYKKVVSFGMQLLYL